MNLLKTFPVGMLAQNSILSFETFILVFSVFFLMSLETAVILQYDNVPNSRAPVQTKDQISALIS